MMWSNYNNLSDIHNIVNTIFENSMRLNTRVRDIIDLSFDEYMILVDRIKSSDSTETIQHFSLCVFVAWVTSYKLNRQDEFNKLMKDIIICLPQHHTKISLDTINDAFYDYQIDTFGHSVNSLKDIRMLAKIHAGFAEPD